MSVWARHWALTQSVGGEGASRAARRCVLNDLADWMIGDDAVECCPTIETIAFDTGFNRQTVMKAIAALIEQGLVTRRFEWEGLKKYAYYRFVGYVPSEWKNTLRPDAKHPEGPRFKTTEKSDVRKAGSTKSCTTEGMKSRTTEGTKSHTHGGTKFRTVPGNKQGITGNEQGSFSPAFACDAPADGVAHKTGVTPSPDDWASLLAEPAPVEDDYPADLFGDVIPDPAPDAAPASKPAPKRSTRAKPKRLCPFDLDSVIPDEWRDAFAADYPTLDLAAEFRKFVGWHVAKGNTYADWKAAFRNWLGNAVKFQARDRNYSKDNRHDVQASRQGSILTPQSEYDYAEGLRIFEARRAARRARDA